MTACYKLRVSWSQHVDGVQPDNRQKPQLIKQNDVTDLDGWFSRGNLQICRNLSFCLGSFCAACWLCLSSFRQQTFFSFLFKLCTEDCLFNWWEHFLNANENLVWNGSGEIKEIVEDKHCTAQAEACQPVCRISTLFVYHTVSYVSFSAVCSSLPCQSASS